MTAGLTPAEIADDAAARWRGGPNVLALLFSQPSSPAIKTLDEDGAYLDERSGETWDLFFPGYYRAGDAAHEMRAGSKPVGASFAKDWFFSSRDFNRLRSFVQDCSDRHWRYSGLTDLVLVCAWLSPESEPIIDWSSTISGSVKDGRGPETLTLNEVIERISDDLETGAEDARFGVGAVTDADQPRPQNGRLVREVMVGALSGIAAALGRGALGV